ncbi:hypothetical protein XENOCAPTIV_012405, partial [Xenoophorus captivus]
FFVKNSQCPLVFIVSGSRSGEGSLHSLFPKEIQEELHISCIRLFEISAWDVTTQERRFSVMYA